MKNQFNMSFISEFKFKVRKNIAFAIIIVLVLFGVNCLTQGSAVAPFIYTIFKVTSILGISAFYHDSAACILKNGKIVCSKKRDLQGKNMIQVILKMQ